MVALVLLWKLFLTLHFIFPVGESVVDNLGKKRYVVIKKYYLQKEKDVL